MGMGILIYLYASEETEVFRRNFNRTDYDAEPDLEKQNKQYKKFKRFKKSKKKPLIGKKNDNQVIQR